jgi:hypothetical protein
MCRKRQSPALSEYLRLLEEFLSHRLAATDFERMYLRMFKDDSTIRSGQEYEILNALFAGADAFCDDPSIAATGALDEEGFRAEARAALEALHRLSRSQA